MSAATRYEHVILDNSNVPTIAGTNMKVIELVTAQIAYGWSPEELHFQFPHLSLGAIYSALAYYWDHQVELDQEIERRQKAATLLQSTLGESPLVARFKAQGLL